MLRVNLKFISDLLGGFARNYSDGFGAFPESNLKFKNSI
jgi:hypothetical protein